MVPLQLNDHVLFSQPAKWLAAILFPPFEHDKSGIRGAVNMVI
jgi:hypothetical protein